MNNILETIARSKREVVSASRRLMPLEELRRLALAVDRQSVSMAGAIMAPGASGIIAEFKRRSPSRGDIAPMACVSDVVPGYEIAGASACSVLTDTRFFGGSLTDLAVAREVAAVPLLRKDFIVDEYQIYEARLWGADAILLIAALLSPGEVEEYAGLAHSLGLEVLLELHDEAELGHVCRGIDMVGVNNRDLTTFNTDLGCSASMIDALQDVDAVKVAESGILYPDDMVRLRGVGYDGFLVGEAFMKTASPGSELLKFVNYESGG